MCGFACVLWPGPLGELLLEKRYDGMAAADAHLQRISDHVSAYLQIVRSQLLATVPKGVVHCMVVPAKETLLSELQEEIAGGWGRLHVQGGAWRGTAGILEGFVVARQSSCVPRRRRESRIVSSTFYGTWSQGGSCMDPESLIH